MQWQITLPSSLSMVSIARRYALAILADCPRRDDVILIVSELTGNAIQHGTGDDIVVTLAAKDRWARVEVANHEGACHRTAGRPKISPNTGEVSSSSTRWPPDGVMTSRRTVAAPSGRRSAGANPELTRSGAR